MKKVLYTILAAAISLSACKKAQNTLPVTGNQSEQATEADGDDSRAIIAGHFKKNDDGLQMDYDLVIRQESEKEYVAIVKFNGLTINGKEVKGSKKEALREVVLTFHDLKVDPKTGAVVMVDEKNSAETEKWEPLSVKGKTDPKTGDAKYIFPIGFDKQISMAYDVTDISLSVTPDNPTFQPAIGIFNNAISAMGVIIIPNSTIDISSGSFEMKESSLMSVNGSNMTAGFGMKLYKDGIITFTDREDYFVLGSGHTVVQEPELSKAKVEGKDGYVTLVFTGDPAQETKTVTYQPEAISANNPKDPKEMIEFPVMKFTLTHFNQKNGVLRFKSTQKWSDLYKTAPDKTRGNVIRQNMMIPVLFRI